MVYVKKLPHNINCPLRLAMKVIEPKWKLCILQNLSDGQSYRPSEIHRLIKEAPSRVLDIRLHELVQEGFVEKTVYPELPPRSEYSITALGLSLMPIIESLREWGVEHYDDFIHYYVPPEESCNK